MGTNTRNRTTKKARSTQTDSGALKTTLESKIRTWISSLSDKEPDIRVEAAIALGKSGDKSALPALMDLVNKDSEPRVRLSAAAAIVAIDPESYSDTTVVGDEWDDLMICTEGQPWTTAQVMKELSIDHEYQLDELRVQGVILGLWYQEDYRYPAWQFVGEGKVLPGLQSVLTALDTYSSWEKLGFMLSKNDRLKNQNTPLNELLQGNIESVVLAATN